MLLTDISRKGLDAYYKNAEEMRKVFYTGMTRAKEELYVMAPETEIEFGEIRYEQQKRKRQTNNGKSLQGLPHSTY